MSGVPWIAVIGHQYWFFNNLCAYHGMANEILPNEILILISVLIIIVSIYFVCSCLFWTYDKLRSRWYTVCIFFEGVTEVQKLVLKFSWAIFMGKKYREHVVFRKYKIFFPIESKGYTVCSITHYNKTFLVLPSQLSHHTKVTKERISERFCCRD